MVEVVTDVVIDEDVDFVVVVVFVVVFVLVVLVGVVIVVFADVDAVLARWVELLVVWRCIPRTLGRVPSVAVSCARRARLTRRMLTKVRFVCNSAFQVIASQS